MFFYFRLISVVCYVGAYILQNGHNKLSRIDKRQVSCPNDGIICSQPLNDKETRQFECNGYCPKGYLCCDDSCFRHKICKQAMTDDNVLDHDGKCPIEVLSCQAPFPPNMYRNLACEDGKCPLGYKCCPDSCFYFKVCKQVDLDHEEDDKDNLVSSTTTESTIYTTTATTTNQENSQESTTQFSTNFVSLTQKSTVVTLSTTDSGNDDIIQNFTTDDDGEEVVTSETTTILTTTVFFTPSTENDYDYEEDNGTSIATVVTPTTILSTSSEKTPFYNHTSISTATSTERRTTIRSEEGSGEVNPEDDTEEDKDSEEQFINETVPTAITTSDDNSNSADFDSNENDGASTTLKTTLNYNQTIDDGGTSYNETPSINSAIINEDGDYDYSSEYEATIESNNETITHRSTSSDAFFSNVLTSLKQDERGDQISFDFSTTHSRTFTTPFYNHTSTITATSTQGHTIIRYEEGSGEVNSEDDTEEDKGSEEQFINEIVPTAKTTSDDNSNISDLDSNENEGASTTLKTTLNYNQTIDDGGTSYNETPSINSAITNEYGDYDDSFEYEATIESNNETITHRSTSSDAFSSNFLTSLKQDERGDQISFDFSTTHSRTFTTPLYNNTSTITSTSTQGHTTIRYEEGSGEVNSEDYTEKDKDSEKQFINETVTTAKTTTADDTNKIDNDGASTTIKTILYNNQTIDDGEVPENESSSINSVLTNEDNDSDDYFDYEGSSGTNDGTIIHRSTSSDVLTSSKQDESDDQISTTKDSSLLGTPAAFVDGSPTVVTIATVTPTAMSATPNDDYEDGTGDDNTESVTESSPTTSKIVDETVTVANTSSDGRTNIVDINSNNQNRITTTTKTSTEVDNEELSGSGDVDAEDGDESETESSGTAL